MRDITAIITMAGFGTRFRKAGYNIPKYMIEARDRTLFDWSMESLDGLRDCIGKYMFVVRSEDHSADFIREHCDIDGLSPIEIVELDSPTDGQATTCLMAISKCSADSPILVYNIDTYVEAGQMKCSSFRGDGCIPCFKASGDHWSFARTDKSGRVLEVKEKVRISDNCSIGAYYFSSAKLYKTAFAAYYTSSQSVEGERYIAPMYQWMIDAGYDVEVTQLDSDSVHVLGTPEELNQFLTKERARFIL